VTSAATELTLTIAFQGFIDPLTTEPLMEYAVELNRLIQLQMVDSIG
jgi:Fe-S cluster assembly scaffold protein SufB